MREKEMYEKKKKKKTSMSVIDDILDGQQNQR